MRRQRRIKCDETRPTCLRCARSDLLCRGYHPPEVKLFELNTEIQTCSSDRAGDPLEAQQKPHCVENITFRKSSDQHHVNTVHHALKSDNSHSPLSREPCNHSDCKRTLVSPRRGTSQIQRSLQMWEGCTEIEIRGLHFFFEKTLPVLKIFSASADTFFTTIVPQMSSHESAIRHQVIALGLAHQRSLSPSNSGMWINVAKNYGYALRCLANDPDIEPHILLSSCLLLLAIEMLCDGPISALNHLKSGLRMLREEETRKRLNKSASTYIFRHLEPIFAQLAATSSPDGVLSIGRMRNLSPQLPDLSQSFKSLDEANTKFLELFQWTEHGGTNHDLSAAWTMWYQHLQSFRSQLDDGFSRPQIQAKLLHAHYLMVQFRAEQRATGDEMSWDLHVEEYRRQMDDCFAICVMTGYPERYPTFGQDKLPGFDLPPGCFPPMWQVATVCRDPAVRRRAIDLIRVHHQRVGHDDECYGVLAATAVMHLEEGDLELTSSSDIPIQRRVRLHEVRPDPVGFLRCTISRWPFTDTESLLVPFRNMPSHRSAFVCSCKSFGMI